ncbi:MAG: hypothetical protein V2J51_13195 [Erythrobacter sp.]|nr:hypothetical protein [Erythrobacter sp.]
MTTAEAILTDLLADESDWWAGEIQTVTGFSKAEFEDLFSRLSKQGFVLCYKDRLMLHQAANNLLGYPDVSTAAVEALLGMEWQDSLEDFMKVMGGK